MPDRTPIMVKIWASGESHEWRYIRRSLASLLNSALPQEVAIVFVDDCSPDPRLQPYLKNLAARHPQVELWRNPQRLGPNKGQEYNVPLLWERFAGAPFILCCDDDIIYHPGWFQRLVQVYYDAANIALHGVFTALNVPFRPSYATVRLPTSEVLLKERQAALNWLVPREVYDLVGPFRDVGVAYDTDYCDRMRIKGLPVICLKPSYVQNIGYHGAYQHDDSYVAPDYVGKLDWYLRVRDVAYLVKRKVRAIARRLLKPEPSSAM